MYTSRVSRPHYMLHSFGTFIYLAKTKFVLARIVGSAVRIVFFFHFELNQIVKLLFEISNRIE